MKVFKGRHFNRDSILWAVRWNCECGIIYRELLAERGANVDHTTVQRYAPEMEIGCAGTGETLPGPAPGISMKRISK